MCKSLSVLDTMHKDWQDRKKWWISTYNIQSELGRGNAISKSKFLVDDKISVFDAYLCELMYTWYTPPMGNILDPFAGGSVRGIVATELDFSYTGIDLSKEQIAANKLQSNKPNWIYGNSNAVLDTITNEYDLVLTCPPYHDLEIYSDHPDDISNMSYEDFIKNYTSILNKAQQKLKMNRFFVLVISEIRDITIAGNYKIGKYKGFVPDTIRIMESLGLHYYNEFILLNSKHAAIKVVDTYFNRNRKNTSIHQNVLVFVKGNPDLATEDINFNGQYMCSINNKLYKSFREASIVLDEFETSINISLTAQEVERRCKSNKSKYKDWKLVINNEAVENFPELKISIDGYLFESAIQAHEYITQCATPICDISVEKIRNRIISNNPQFRHWIKIEPITNISYDDHKKSLENIKIIEKLNSSI